MRILLRLVLLAEKVDAFLPSMNSEVFIPLSLLSNKFFYLRFSLELQHLNCLRTTFQPMPVHSQLPQPPSPDPLSSLSLLDYTQISGILYVINSMVPAFQTSGIVSI